MSFGIISSDEKERMLEVNDNGLMFAKKMKTTKSRRKKKGRWKK